MIKYLAMMIIFVAQLTYAADKEQLLDAIAQGLTPADFAYLEDLFYKDNDLFMPDEFLEQMFSKDHIAIPDQIIVEEDDFLSRLYCFIKCFLARMPARQD